MTTAAPSLKILAAQLDLSVSTVARALRKDPAISATTRERVMAAAAAAGYRPSRIARALVSGRTGQVGIHLAICDGASTDIALRLERLAAADGFATMLSTAAVAPAGWFTDGEIVIGTLSTEQERALSGSPLVTTAAHATADCIEVDFASPTAEAVRRLVALGCRTLWYCAAAEATDDARLRAYHAAMAATGMAPRAISAGGRTRAAGRAAIAAALAADAAPDAILCLTDELAVGADRALVDAGAGATQVVGCDGLEELVYRDRPLSTIVQPVEALCAAAWAALRRRMADPRQPQQRIALAARLELRAARAALSPEQLLAAAVVVTEDAAAS
jgi:DNA-binding LacI/PurR family transcriptional regulator